MKTLSIALIVVGLFVMVAGEVYGEVVTVVIGVLNVETTATTYPPYDQKRDLMQELQKNARLKVVDIPEACNLSDLTKDGYARAQQYKNSYKLDMLLHTNHIGSNYYFNLIDLYRNRVKKVSLAFEGAATKASFWRISKKLLTKQDYNRVVRAKKEAQGITEVVSHEFSEDFYLLIEQGPSLIAEGSYLKVLDLIQVLPAKERVNVQIRTLECFAHLKGWVVDKDANCKLSWWSMRQKLINLGDKEATPLLIVLLKDPDQWVRKYAAELLGYIGDERAADALREVAQNDEKFGVRKYAKWAYKEIFGEEP